MSNTDYYRRNTEPGESAIEPCWFIEYPFWDQLVMTFLGPEFITLTERISPPVEGTKREWKNFEHYKCASSKPASLPVTFASSSSSWNPGWDHFKFAKTTCPGVCYDYSYGPPGELNKGLPEYWDNSREVVFIPPPSDLSNRLDIAFKTMLPNIKANLSLANSIYELKDLRSVPQSLRNARDLLSKILSKRETVQRASDLYLQKKFNVDPLRSDVKACKGIISNIKKRVRSLLSLQGKAVRSHYTCEILEHPDLHEEGTWRGFAGQINRTGWYCSDEQLYGVAKSSRHVSNVPSVFHVELLYTFRYTELQNQLAGLFSTLDSLGLNLNPAIIWNAIPWSFVVDWFVGVSRALDNFHIGLMDPEVCLHRALWSIKRKRTTYVETQVLTQGFGGSVVGLQHLPLPPVYESAYRRQRCWWQDVVPSFKTSGLSLVEGSLASALVLSRRVKRKSRRSK